MARDVVIVGAGPAGIAAACAAAECGAHVRVIDDNASAGGQIWRGHNRSPNPQAARWLDRSRRLNIEWMRETQVIDAPGAGVLALLVNGQPVTGRYDALILATGARELFLPFPGWTLPGVMGAGGLQALAKSGWPVRGKRVVVAGSGPLLLPVAAYLRKSGASVALLAEQSPFATIARFAISLASSPAKLWQAVQLKSALGGVRQRFSTWPVRADGHERLERVTLRTDRGEETLECDYLACGFGLVPNVELAVLLGCQLERNAVWVDQRQQTSIANVFAAGEATGVGGVEKATAEGELAGLAACGEQAPPSLHLSVAAARRWAARLDRVFALRSELRALAGEATIVCRCEDVPWSRLKACETWREAKLHTRCGMGPCQGRVCGAALSFLRDWERPGARPPLFPVPLHAMTFGGRDRSEP